MFTFATARPFSLSLLLAIFAISLTAGVGYGLGKTGYGSSGSGFEDVDSENGDIESNQIVEGEAWLMDINTGSTLIFSKTFPKVLPVSLTAPVDAGGLRVQFCAEFYWQTPTVHQWPDIEIRAILPPWGMPPDRQRVRLPESGTTTCLTWAQHIAAPATKTVRIWAKLLFPGDLTVNDRVVVRNMTLSAGQ